jgi:PAS domain S-box-containing protein
LDTEKLDNKENKANLGQQFLLLSNLQTLQEKALEYEKQNYIKYLLDYSSDFQIALDGEGKIRRVNQAFEEITGKKKQELIGSFIYEFMPEEIIKKLIAKIIQEKRVKNMEIKVNRPGREPLIGDFSGVVFTSKEGENIIYLSGRDIATERRKLQQNLMELNENLEKKVMKKTKELRKVQCQLIQSEKLSLIGELVTGVAHEVRNPLATISLIVQHLESKYADNYQIEKLKAIQRNINRIDKIVYGLLNFSHPPRFNFDYHNVNEILERLERLEPILKHFLPENIKIIRKYDSKLPQGWFDSDCLEQVFLNLISNAIRAMKDGGELYITTSFDSTRKGIIIKFEDTGVGISKGNLKKIFKPFFTTYEEGTGLGLSICQNIIKEHKGNISVESKLGKGTIFTIFLPLEKRKEKKQVVDGI